MLKDEIEKIIRNINIGSPEDGDISLESRIGDEGIKEALTRILELVEKCVPEEREMKYSEYDDDFPRGQNKGLYFGYNQAITEIKRRIG